MVTSDYTSSDAGYGKKTQLNLVFRPYFYLIDEITLSGLFVVVSHTRIFRGEFTYLFTEKGRYLIAFP